MPKPYLERGRYALSGALRIVPNDQGVAENGRSKASGEETVSNADYICTRVNRRRATVDTTPPHPLTPLTAHRTPVHGER